MSTFKQKLKEVKQLLSKTYDTTIRYVVVRKPTDTYDFFSRKPPSLGALAGGRIEK